MAKVLVVDDEQEIVDFLTHFLERLGITFFKALDGETAINIFKEKKPDWVFLDIKMPGLDGFETFKELKKVDPKVRAIMLTGKAERESQDKAKKMGVIDYIIKPLDLEELHNKIKTHILK